MENLLIAATKKTPEIVFKRNGELKVSGRSLPENVAQFYLPAHEWLEELISYEPPAISLTIDLEYMNTSSTRNIMRILKTLGSLDGTILNITWVYEQEDEDMLQQGQIFESSFNLQFSFIEKEVAW